MLAGGTERERLMKDGWFPTRWQFGPITLHPYQVWPERVSAFTSTNDNGKDPQSALTATSVGCREHSRPWSSKLNHHHLTIFGQLLSIQNIYDSTLLILLVWTSIWWSCWTPSDCAIAHDFLVSTLESFRISAPHSGKHLHAIKFYNSFPTLETLWSGLCMITRSLTDFGDIMVQIS